MPETNAVGQKTRTVKRHSKLRLPVLPVSRVRHPQLPSKGALLAT